MIERKEADTFLRQFLDRIQVNGLADLLLAEASAVLTHMHTDTDKPTTEDIYTRLCELMHRQALYTNPHITRKQVARMLGTNETYLYNTLYHRLGITFKAYIRGLRIAHACTMLEETTKIPHSIEEIGLMSGFISRTTFYRQFRDLMRTTPDEYRKRKKK